MKIVLLFSIILLSQAVTEAQKISDGLYLNTKSKEFVYIYNDSMQFRLCNRDAFGTFTIGKGHYEFKGRDKYYIQQCESIKEQTSIIEHIPRIDSLISIRTYYNDGSPIISSYVYFKEISIPKKDSKIVCVSDINGMILLSDGQAKRLNNKDLLLHIEALGFSTEKRVVLRRGYEYTVHSTIPNEYPFTVFKTGNILINRDNNKDIEVEIWRRNKERKRSSATKLRKVDVDYLYSQFLLDKDL